MLDLMYQYLLLKLGMGLVPTTLRKRVGVGEKKGSVVAA